MAHVIAIKAMIGEKLTRDVPEVVRVNMEAESCNAVVLLCGIPLLQYESVQHDRHS